LLTLHNLRKILHNDNRHLLTSDGLGISDFAQHPDIFAPPAQIFEVIRLWLCVIPSARSPARGQLFSSFAFRRRFFDLVLLGEKVR